MVDCRSADADNRRLSKECFLLGLIDGSRPRCSIGFAGGWEGFCLIGYVPDLSLARGGRVGGKKRKKDKKGKTGRGLAGASAVGTTSEWVRLRRMESVDCGAPWVPQSTRPVKQGLLKMGVLNFSPVVEERQDKIPTDRLSPVGPVDPPRALL